MFRLLPPMTRLEGSENEYDLLAMPVIQRLKEKVKENQDNQGLETVNINQQSCDIRRVTFLVPP